MLSLNQITHQINEASTHYDTQSAEYFTAVTKQQSFIHRVMCSVRDAYASLRMRSRLCPPQSSSIEVNCLRLTKMCMIDYYSSHTLHKKPFI